uniref:Uncharacterized protein n=1 Tax=Opuntia streptacantha TaxID=393608 RepID=A0A7C8Z952_OPUST
MSNIFVQLEIDYVLFFGLTEENNASKTTVASTDGTNKDKAKLVDGATMKKFKKDNKIVRGHLFNHMINPLFDPFVIIKFSKIIWEKPEIKGGADGAGKKKYTVDEWLQFWITNDKPS